MQYTPKGILIAVGGNENKGSLYLPGMPEPDHAGFLEYGILRRILREVDHTGDRLEIITTASQIPQEVGNNYLQAFHKLNFPNVGLMHIRTRKDAANPEYLQRIKSAGGVLFSGGDQLRLSTVFSDTRFREILFSRYWAERFVIAGTSAGAMAMSKVMVARGEIHGYLLKGGVQMSTGLSFAEDLIIDTHFVNRGRFGRLVEVVATHPGCLGIGLGEDTGMVIREGNLLEIIGSGAVMLVDGSHITHCNVGQTSKGEPLSVENMKVHVLTRGNGYLVQEKKFLTAVTSYSPVRNSSPL
jgi:cyanophycinase